MTSFSGGLGRAQVLSSFLRRHGSCYRLLVLPELLSISPAVSSSSRIELFAIFVPYLATRFTPSIAWLAQSTTPLEHEALPVLAAFIEPLVKIGPNHSFV